jgi:hypothetical protein
MAAIYHDGTAPGRRSGIQSGSGCKPDDDTHGWLHGQWRAERRRIERLELLDELEEWILLQVRVWGKEGGAAPVLVTIPSDSVNDREIGEEVTLQGAQCCLLGLGMGSSEWVSLTLSAGSGYPSHYSSHSACMDGGAMRQTISSISQTTYSKGCAATSLCPYKHPCTHPPSNLLLPNIHQEHYVLVLGVAGDDSPGGWLAAALHLGRLKALDP